MIIPTVTVRMTAVVPCNIVSSAGSLMVTSSSMSSVVHDAPQPLTAAVDQWLGVAGTDRGRGVRNLY